MAAHADIEAVDNDLLRLLLRATPPDLSGDVTITFLARKLGVSRTGIYKRIALEKISPEFAVKVVRLSRGRVSLDEFHPYVYRLSREEIEKLSSPCT